MEEESILDCIKTVADALNIDIFHQISAWKQRKVASGSFWMSSCNSKPIDEFESLEELLAGGFLHVFTLGVAFQPRQHSQKHHSDDDSDVVAASKRRLTKKDAKHMLLQFTTMVATSRELLFCLFDHHMRHSVIKNMHAKIQKNL